MKRFILLPALTISVLSFGQVWNPLGLDIDGEDASDESGYSVSINSVGSHVAIGSYLNNSSLGHVRIYEWDGNIWSQLGLDIDNNEGEYSGYSISLDGLGGNVAIGAPQNDNGNGNNAGHVRLYEWDGATWMQVGFDIDGEAADDWSGHSVSMNAVGERVAIGAPKNDGNGNNAGHVRIYERDGFGWVQLGLDIDGENGVMQSGWSVSLNSIGDRVAIGAPWGTGPGQVRIYEWDGVSWNQLGLDLDGENNSDLFGYSVSINSIGDRVAIGAPDNNGNGSFAGHVRIYEWDGNAWLQMGQDIDGEATYDYSGWSVSINSIGDRVAIGSEQNNGNGNDAGHVRFYEWDGTGWVQLGQDVDGEAAGDHSGSAVSINANGDRVAIGARLNDGNGNASGHVRIYELKNNCDLINLQVNQSHVSCPGGSDGGINVNVNPSGGPYSYQWNNGDTTQNLINISAGNYELTITAATGCDTTIQVPIFQPPPLQTSIAWTDATCGNQDGTATLTIANLYNPPYNSYWSNGDSLQFADTLWPGVVNVMITDGNGCTFYDAVMIGNTGGSTVDASNFTDVSCPGGNDGSISLAITTQDPPYSVNWMSGQSTDQLNGLGAGIYQYMVEDQSGCITTGSVEILQPDSIILTAVNLTHPTCGNADGSIQVSAQGGTGNLIFIWDANAGSQVGATVSGLAANNYTVNIIDANSCVQTESILLDDISGPQIDIVNVVSPHCGGGPGGINIAISAGTPPYSYQWSNGSTNQNLFGVSSGNYGVVVTDANGCSSVEFVPLNGILPNNPGVCLVTVDSTTQTNLVVWEKPAIAGSISHYNIYKEGIAAGVYDSIATVPYDSLSQYTDTLANPAYRSWSYKITVVDTCGNESMPSPAHKTIHLTTNLGLSNVINLIWDNYTGFSYPTYFINRYHPSTGWNVIATIPSSLTSYTDQTPPSPSNDLIYSIEVVPPSTCTSTKSVDHNTTRSNRQTVLGGGGQSILQNPNSNVNVYPNPTHDQITIDIKGCNGVVNVEVYDLQGRLLETTTNTIVSLKKHAKGIYVLKVSYGEITEEVRVVRD